MIAMKPSILKSYCTQ